MKKIGVLLAEGFEEVEALTVVDYFRRAGGSADMISVDNKDIVTGDHGISVRSDIKMSQAMDKSYDALVVPGGLPGSKALTNSVEAQSLLKKANDDGKYICAICAGPMAIVEAGITEGKAITGYPGFFEDEKGYEFKEDKVVVDSNLITSRGPALAVYFALAIIEEILGEDKRKEVEEGILLDIMEK